MSDKKAVADLGTFEDLKVQGVTLDVRGAGGGLNPAMEIEPTIVHQGDVFYVVYEVKCIDVAHPLADEKNADAGVHRKQIGRVLNGIIIDRESVAVAMEAMKKRIQEKRDAESGAQALDLDYDPLGVGDNKSDDDMWDSEDDGVTEAEQAGADATANDEVAAKREAKKAADAKATTGKQVTPRPKKAAAKKAAAKKAPAKKG